MKKNTCLKAVSDFLCDVGYGPANIEYDYRFVANGQIQVADMVAFSVCDQKDLKTSCISVKFFENKQAAIANSRDLIYTASPIAILPTPEEVLFIPQRVQTHHEIRPIPYQELIPFAQNNRFSFLPQSIMAIKSEGRQLSLFELDPLLYEFISEVSKKDLVNRFEQAIKSTSAYLEKTKALTSDNHSRIIKIAIKILAAKILEDKNILGDSGSRGARSLMDIAGAKFPGYFSWDFNSIFERKSAELIYETLGKDFTYKAISNEQLGFFYENTFVTEDVRKSLGIYYTPQKIAKEMLRVLPIEEIEPEKRFVFDGTCGSGSLLTAAFYRLNDLLPVNMSHCDRHSFLVRHISGIDKDPFAVEIAKKSLLLASLPLGDSWKIANGDFLAKSPNEYEYKPNIIVANPPFLETGKDIKDQKATYFLEKYIDLLPEGGLLSIVLPEPFLKNISCRQSRAKLISELNILEMWQLPEGAFPMAQFSTVIISGQKKASSLKQSAPFRVRRLLKKDEVLKHSYNPIQFDFSLTYGDVEEIVGTENRLDVSLFPKLWSKLKSLDKLGDHYKVANGIRPGTSGRVSITNKPITGSYKYLHSPKSMSPYVVSWQDQYDFGDPSYVTYPGLLEKPRLSLKSIFESKNKLLVNANRSTSNPWRVYAAIDREGIFPSQGFYILSPKSDQSPCIEIVTAIINSFIANAYVDNFNRALWINSEVIKKIPFPQFSSSQVIRIKKLVDEIEKAKQNKPEINERAQRIQEELDDLIFMGYNLDENEIAIIKSLFNSYNRPGFRAISKKAMNEIASVPDIWKVTGTIVDFNSSADQVSIWILGYNSLERPITIPIPVSLPGWALKRNMDFEAKIPFSQRNLKDISKLDFLEFSLLKNQFLDDDSILSDLDEGHR
jgi:type I restriction-modification system DNA methylase subunit